MQLFLSWKEIWSGQIFWSRARQALLSREHAINKTRLLNCSFRHLLHLNTWLPLSLKLTFSSQNRYQKFSRWTACLGPCLSGKEGQNFFFAWKRKGKSTCPRWGFLQALNIHCRSVNCAVSNIEGLKLKITAHKTFKNKFGQIHSGIKFIYCQNTSMIGSVYSDSQTSNVWPPIRMCSFVQAAMQANVFSIEKTHQHTYFILVGDSFIVSINNHN